jgi:hypothetical protein
MERLFFYQLAIFQTVPIHAQTMKIETGSVICQIPTEQVGGTFALPLCKYPSLDH